MLKYRHAAALICVTTLAAAGSTQAVDRPHNIVLFVADGLRAGMVNPETAPAMSAVKAQGVDFANSHAMFPTFTMPNASALATGHYLGDTGIFSNTLYTGFAATTAAGSVTPFIENDAVLGELGQHFGGNFINETTLVAAAREAGMSTGIVGKVGPTLVFDLTERSGETTIVFDDATGSATGIPLSKAVADALAASGLATVTPARGDNGKAGNATTPGTSIANAAQQDYLVDVTTKVLLPLFKARNRPFVLVFWSRDPDGSQHNQGDSLNQVVPGINGPTSLAAIRNADSDLARLRAALNELELADTTDIVVTADHGFGTISKESKTSAAAQASYGDVPAGFLPPGFVALDLAKSLGMALFDPTNANAPVATGNHPKAGNALLGADPADPDLVVAANGGSDLVYLPKRDTKLAMRVVKALLAQDYVSALFVDDALGKIPGTLPLSSIALEGSALTPTPSMVIGFRNYASGCELPTNCMVEVADTTLQQGQGMHGTFGRGDTHNFMAAIGPDFKTGYIDRVPASNADLGQTLAHLLGLHLAAKGKLAGRVLAEAIPGGKAPHFSARVLASQPGAHGLRTTLYYQHVGTTRYFDAAGIPGRTLDPRSKKTSGAKSAKP